MQAYGDEELSVNSVVLVAGILSKSPEAEDTAGGEAMQLDAPQAGPARLVSCGPPGVLL